MDNQFKKLNYELPLCFCFEWHCHHLLGMDFSLMLMFFLKSPDKWRGPLWYYRFRLEIVWWIIVVNDFDITPQQLHINTDEKALKKCEVITQWWIWEMKIFADIDLFLIVEKPCIPLVPSRNRWPPQKKPPGATTDYYANNSISWFTLLNAFLT